MEKGVSVPRHSLWVAKVRTSWASTLHVDSGRLLKCPNQANFEEVMLVQSLAVPKL